MNTKLEQNIKVSYIYNFFMHMDITSAIWVLYLGFKGMSLVQIGLLESIYHITGLIFELPTGAIADLYGRKFSVVLGRVISVISCILMMMSNTFFGFAIAFVLSSASMNLNSGAQEALVYDSLKELGEEQKYKKLWGQLAFIMSIAQGLAVLLGGILADTNFLYAYILGGVIQIIAVMVSVKFYEPKIEEQKEMNNKSVDKKGVNILNQLTKSINMLSGRKIVMYAILFSALAGSLQTTVFFYSQQYFYNLNFSKTAIALICAAGSLIEAFSSKYAYLFENKYGISGTLISIFAANIIALAGMAIARELSIVFFIMTSVTGGLAFTILSDYVNARIPSEHRATILSFDSLCFSIFMICVFPAFGILAEYMGFAITYGAMAIIYIPAMIFLLLKMKKHKNIEMKEEINDCYMKY